MDIEYEIVGSDEIKKKCDSFFVDLNYSLIVYFKIRQIERRLDIGIVTRLLFQSLMYIFHLYVFFKC